MAEWFKRLLKSKEERQAEEYKKFAQTEAFQDIVRQQAQQLLEQTRIEADRQKAEQEAKRRQVLETAEETISILTEEMQNSSKPYVVIRSLDFTPERGIGIKLDYNPAFIRYLASNGVTGVNEDEIIRKWLALLSNEIMNDSMAEDYVLNGVSEDELPGIGLEEILRELNKEQDDENEPDPRW